MLYAVLPAPNESTVQSESVNLQAFTSSVAVNWPRNKFVA